MGKLKNSPLAISFIIAFTHCVVGTILAKYDTNGIIEILFMPYTFIAGMSYFAGWGALSFLLEFISLLLITLMIYPIVIIVVKDSPKRNE